MVKGFPSEKFHGVFLKAAGAVPAGRAREPVPGTALCPNISLPEHLSGLALVVGKNPRKKRGRGFPRPHAGHFPALLPGFQES